MNLLFCTFCNQDVAPYKELKSRQGIISRCPLCTNVFQEQACTNVFQEHDAKQTPAVSSHEKPNASQAELSTSDIRRPKVITAVKAVKNVSAAHSFSKPGQLERALRKRLSEIQKQIRAIQVLEKEKQRIQLMLDALTLSEPERSCKKKHSAS